MSATWMLWAGLQINGESLEQHERTGLLCKVRSSDTAFTQEERARESERAGTQSHATLSVGRLPVCVW